MARYFFASEKALSGSSCLAELGRNFFPSTITRCGPSKILMWRPTMLLAMKISVFALAIYVLLEFVWGMRPPQSYKASPKSFRLGDRDPIFWLFYKFDGTPRKYAWLAQLAVGAVFLYFAWIGS
jgi:hypothetical protein